ncbi:MAG: quinone-dependent dihydroorotate dehydrogenase [Bacteroidales bacterium]
MIYKWVIKPLLFLFPPETIHHGVVNGMRLFFRIPFFKKTVQSFFKIQDKRLETEVLGLKFPNKIGLAAGFDKKANIYNHMAAFGFGHVEIGTVNPLPQPGNPKPRLFRLKKDKALINRMGFNNPGVDVFVENLKKDRPEIIIGGNIGKNTLTSHEDADKDYVTCFRKLYPWVDYFVVNVSCPNIEGLNKLQDKDELIALLEKINTEKKNFEPQKPILLKISPDLTELLLDDVIAVVDQCSLDGIIATNTTTSRNNLQTPEKKLNETGKGGLSGAPLRNKSTEVIRYLVKKTSGKIPVIGVGGIMSVDDALEKLEAGASLLQIYTGFVYEGPGLVKRINKELLKKQKRK